MPECVIGDKGSGDRTCDQPEEENADDVHAGSLSLKPDATLYQRTSNVSWQTFR
jgi:hypothetical protein